MSISLQFLTLRQGTDNTFKCHTSKRCIPFNKVSQNLNSQAIPQIFLLLVGSTTIFHLNNSGLKNKLIEDISRHIKLKGSSELVTIALNLHDQIHV